MMVMTLDRRTDHYIAAKCATLDRLNDVTALSQEGRLWLVRGHSAHVRNDWRKYLVAVDAINRKLVAIADIAKEWSGEVRDAPCVAPDQLDLSLTA